MIENFRLRVFRAVARHGSFSRAGEELLLTQPAVTQQVKALEAELGVPLFDRSGGAVRLTPGGHALLPYAEKLKELSNQAVTAVAQAYGDQGGELALGASQTIGQYVLPRLIAGFLQAHPRVQVSARSGNSDAMLEALLAHEIQVALVEGPELRNGLGVGLRIEPFMEDRMVLVVPGGHEWADSEIALAALAGEPLLMREFGSGSRRVVEHALSAAGLKAKDLQVRMELDSTEGLLSAVEAGLGITFVSQWAVRHRLASGTLRQARVQGLRLFRHFSLACLAGPEPVGSAGAFRAFLLSEATGSFVKRSS